MALPKPNAEEVAEVEATEKQEVREEAEVKAKETAVATVAAKDLDSVVPAEAYDPIKYLEELSITDIHIDFTSFDTIVLDKGKFKQAGTELGDEFEFIFMDKRRTHLFRGQEDRDSDPELVYSDDGVHSNKDQSLIADHVAEWKEKGWDNDRTVYVIVMATKVGGDDDGEIIQLQIPKTSIGKLDGHLVTLAMAKINPKTVVTKATIGATIGKGIKAFNPWVFRKA